MPIKHKILAGNWKLNKSPSETKEFLMAFSPKVATANAEVLIFPSAFSLQAAIENKGVKIKVGPQNVNAEDSGAFTGENSAAVAKAMGASHVLVGHSERRSLFGEVDSILAKKTAKVQSLGLIPVFCVGETLAQREANQTWSVVEKQLSVGLEAANEKLIVAYEPVWAIGTGKVATPEQAEEVHAQISPWLEKRFGKKDIAILYGGSVTPENAATLYQKPNIHGFLVGGASLKVESFASILAAMA